MLLSSVQKNSLETATAKYQASVGDLASYLLGRGISKQAALDSRLGCVSDPEPGHERFRGWLAIPFITDAGVVAMKFRCASDHHCKAVDCQRYDAPAGQKARLFNAGVLAQGGEVCAVVEGEIKAIVTTHELGIPAVGTSAGVWLDHWPRCLADYDRVLVIADNDIKADGSNPGVRHAKKVLATLPQGELVTPPPGIDIDDWIVRDGAEAVRERIGLK